MSVFEVVTLWSLPVSHHIFSMLEGKLFLYVRKDERFQKQGADRFLVGKIFTMNDQAKV